jgi:hypothetical protein
MPFDPTFSMGPRHAFTWPGPLEPATAPDSLLGHDMTSLNPGSEASLTPPSIASSLTSSPPRHSLTPEQHELKRQQDRARRDSRLASRLRRVSSQTSYLESPPLTGLPDVTSAMDLPSYTTATAPMSLLTEPAGPMATSYMPSYSPPLHDPSQAQVFPTPYGQSM